MSGITGNTSSDLPRMRLNACFAPAAGPSIKRPMGTSANV
jgi:hypothetical protein